MKASDVRITPEVFKAGGKPRTLPVSERGEATPSDPHEKLDLTGKPVVETPVVVTQEEKAPTQETSSGPAPLKDQEGRALTTSVNGTLAVLDPTPRDQEFLDKYGPWGVVTGASGGIGAEYAQVLAEKGMNLVLVARSQDRLETLASELRAAHGVDVRVVGADLSTAEGADRVKQATEDLEVGLLVNNAGTWQMGRFLDNDIGKDVNSVGLNVEAPIRLTHHFAKSMAERGRGGVINVGSNSGRHGVPGQAAYSATKGFLNNFSEALYHELKPKGVDVLVTNPGPVKGEASSSIYDQSRLPLPVVTGREVATQSLDRLGRGSSTTPNWLVRTATSAALRLMPRDFLVGVAGYIAEQAMVEKPSAPAPEPKADAGQSFTERYGPWGVVTGASQGLGAEYAEQLAQRGMNVVVVARSADKLEALADRLREQYGVQVRALPADLSSREGVARVDQATRDLDVGLLVNNAGAWQMSPFLGNDVEKEVFSVSVNASAPLELSHAFGQRMAARGSGGIINVGSGSALTGVPGQATYSGTKAFLRNLTESLHNELKPHGVDVLITHPGPIKGDASAAVYDTSKLPMQELEPKAIVVDSLDKLGQGSSNTVPGWFNRVALAVASRALPRDLLCAITGYILERAHR